MAESQVHGGSGSFEEIGEQTSVDVGLLVEEIKLSTIGALRGEVVGENLGLQTLGEVILELKLGVKAVGRGPCLGEGKA